MMWLGRRFLPLRMETEYGTEWDKMNIQKLMETTFCAHRLNHEKVLLAAVSAPSHNCTIYNGILSFSYVTVLGYINHQERRE